MGISNIKYIGSLQFSGAADVEEGGGGDPEWVPEGATDFIDFTGDRSWNGVEGEASSFVGEEPLSTTSWAATGFEPTQLSENGYLVDASPFAFAILGETLTRILAGATVVIEWVPPSASNNVMGLVACDENLTTGLEFDIDLSGLGPNNRIYGFGLSSFIDATGTTSIVEGATNRAAITLTASRAEWSVNGDAVTGFDPDPADWGAIDYVLVGFTSGSLLKSIAVYEPQAAAALPGLSA